MASLPLDQIPTLHHHTTLNPPATGTRSWSSAPHPSSRTPLLATATSDKSVHIWDMRDWRLLSTIAGGHKRSVRCVAWKDYGEPKRKKVKAVQTEDDGERKPVILATGSFDANAGLWVWNRDRSAASRGRGQDEGSRQVPGAFEEDEEQDFTNEGEQDEEEEWNFSTLLTGPDSEIKDLAFSPPHYGANLLATCSRDKSVWVWEEVAPEEWETVAVLGEHAGDVKCVQWLKGACTSQSSLRRRLQRRREGADGIVQTANGIIMESDDDEEVVLGGRELLASGSYDDTIRLHHDDEAEGDWLTIAVLTGHDGTVWDLKFEPYVNLSSYPLDTSEGEVIADWEPRLLSCSDDLTVRLWKKQLTEKERDEKQVRTAEARHGQAGGNVNSNATGVRETGFASSRIPSVIRPATSTEKWVEETKLPAVHARSVYAIDWSSHTGLVVSCGGDGVIAVYQEVSVPGAGDVIMNGTAEADNAEDEIKKVKTEWKVVAVMEAAHDEYEINHVCWAPKRDAKRLQPGLNGSIDTEQQSEATNDEEYIISTGDDGQVRVWRLPNDILEAVR